MSQPRPPARPADTPPLDPDQLRPNPDETVTMTARGVGSVWAVHSSRVEHRIVVTTTAGERQVVEYPWDEWAAAARAVVSFVNAEYIRAGSAPSVAPVYCGECGERATRLEDGRASCASHGTSA